MTVCDFGVSMISFTFIQNCSVHRAHLVENSAHFATAFLRKKCRHQFRIKLRVGKVISCLIGVHDVPAPTK